MDSMIAFIYRAFGAMDDLLYVGITTDPKTRLRDHSISKSWWKEVGNVTLEVLPSWAAASQAETLAIATEYPRYNKHPGNQAAPIRDKKVNPPKTYQPLPDEEIRYLLSLTEHGTIERAYELYRAGWSMKAILRGVTITPSSAWLANQFGFHLAEPTGVPLPEMPLSPTAEKIKARKEEEAHRMRAQLSATEKDRIRELAQTVAKYRPTCSATHPATIAVGQYNTLIRELKARGVRAQEMADAAGVSESNIRRRLKD